MPGRLVTRPYRDADADSATRCLLRAFHADPLMRAMVDDCMRHDWDAVAPVMFAWTTWMLHASYGMTDVTVDADTGEVLCNMTSKYGHEAYGNTSAVFNEADYIAILPCIFGHQPGLQRPFTFGPDTRLRAIKYFNNTFRHLGQMAQWTGLMVYDTDPY